MNENLHTIEQTSKILDLYIKDSSAILRKKLKNVWIKSQSLNVKVGVVKHENLLHR